VVRQPRLAPVVPGLPEPRAAPQDAVAPRRRAALELLLALLGLLGAAVVGVGVRVVLVRRRECDRPLVPAVERSTFG
jgi:hypothetical protein